MDPRSTIKTLCTYTRVDIGCYAHLMIGETHMCACPHICTLEKWFPLQGERAHCLKLFCMYDKRFEISKTK